MVGLYSNQVFLTAGAQNLALVPNPWRIEIWMSDDAPGGPARFYRLVLLSQ